MEYVKETITRAGHRSRTNDGALWEGALPAFTFGALVRVGVLYTPNVVWNEGISTSPSDMEAIAVAGDQFVQSSWLAACSEYL